MFCCQVFSLGYNTTFGKMFTCLYQVCSLAQQLGTMLATQQCSQVGNENVLNLTSSAFMHGVQSTVVLLTFYTNQQLIFF